MNKIFLEFLRWNLRFHGLFHLVHIIQDILGPVTPNWGGVFLHLYIIFIEILASFYIPKHHIHIKPIKSEVHEKCPD
tara:strand:+ start:319 stop:549 length:231 start_codon:yes stop_codon:yes gene_type:complete